MITPAGGAAAAAGAAGTVPGEAAAAASVASSASVSRRCVNCDHTIRPVRLEAGPTWVDDFGEVECWGPYGDTWKEAGVHKPRKASRP